MTPECEIEIKTKIRLDIDLVARWFANLSDDVQALFFVAVCEEAKKWPRDRGINFGPSHQWWLIGSHLRNCECSSEDARNMICEMFEGVQNGTHGVKEER